MSICKSLCQLGGQRHFFKTSQEWANLVSAYFFHPAADPVMTSSAGHVPREAQTTGSVHEPLSLHWPIANYALTKSDEDG